MDISILSSEAQCIADSLLLKVSAQNDWPTVITAATIYTKLVAAAKLDQAAAAPAEEVPAVDASEVNAAIVAAYADTQEAGA